MFWVDVVYSFQNDFFFLLVFEDLDSFCTFVWSFFSSIRQSPVVGLDGIKWRFIYLKTATILTEEWGFSLPCCLMPHPATPPPLPQPAKARAAAVQVLGDSDKTNFSYQQTIVSNSWSKRECSALLLGQDGTGLLNWTVVLCVWSRKRRRGADHLPSNEEVEFRATVLQMSKKRYGSQHFCF